MRLLAGVPTVVVDLIVDTVIGLVVGVVVVVVGVGLVVVVGFTAPFEAIGTIPLLCNQ
jgi:hypothetical protein